MSGPFASVPRATGAEPMWAAVDGRVSALSADEVVFHDPATGRSHVMTRQVLQALDLCRPFRPLQAHAEAVAEAIPGLKGRVQAVRPVLENLATRGLLVSDDAFVLRWTSGKGEAPAPMAGLFIRACDRPAQLVALLDSIAREPAILAQAGGLVVVDDSRDPAAVAAHAAALRALAVATAAPVHHVTPALRDVLVEELCAALPARAAALSPLLRNHPHYGTRSGGAHGRNIATLLAAGQRYLILDDDNLFPLCRFPGASLGLDIGGGYGVVRTYASQAEALASATPDPDALAAHIALCGAPLGAHAAPQGILRFGREELAGFAPSREPQLDGAAQVVLTVNGHRGGSCNSSISWLLTLDAQSRAGLCRSEADYLAGRGDPAVCVGYERAHPVPTAGVSAFAVDNRLLMPCTVPGRAEDLVYNALVTAGRPRSAQLLLPWTVGHLPAVGRDRSPQVGRPREVDANVCLAALVGHVASDLHAESPAVRYALVAAKLDEVAGGSDATLLGYLREYLVYERASLLASLQEALPAAADGPEALRADIRAHLEANARAIVERGVPRFTGWPEDWTAERCAAAFRFEAGVLAEGLRAWPEAWAVAAARREHWLARARLPG